MAEIEGLVRALREGDDAAKIAAAQELCTHAEVYPNRRVMIVEACAIAPLVDLLRDKSATAKHFAVRTLDFLVRHTDNQVLIAEAGGIPPLVDLQRHGWVTAGEVLLDIAHNNDVNAVAIAMTVGFDALVELARRGSVTVNNWSGPRDINGRGLLRPEEELIVSNAGVPAKRKAARILLRKCLPRAIPDEIAADTAAFLEELTESESEPESESESEPESDY